jgi:hypothetical protein
MTFTAAGILELAKVGILPDIGDEEIKDRSEADALLKTFVCIQLAWFLAQRLARTIKNLPITLLELHVILHTFCATLILYGSKSPMTSDRRTSAKTRESWVMAAFFALKSTTEERCGEHSGKNVQEHTIELNSVKIYGHK